MTIGSRFGDKPFFVMGGKQNDKKDFSNFSLILIFILTINIGIFDTRWALIGPYVALNLPISVFILTTFMASVSKELETMANRTLPLAIWQFQDKLIKGMMVGLLKGRKMNQRGK